MLGFQALRGKDSRWPPAARALPWALGRAVRGAKCLIGNAGSAAGLYGLCPGAPPMRLVV